MDAISLGLFMEKTSLKDAYSTCMHVCGPCVNIMTVVVNVARRGVVNQ